MSSIETSPLIATWLIAEDQDRSLIGVIDDLSVKYDAPKFAPHITMSALHVPSNEIIIASEVLSGIAQNFKPLTLRVAEVGYADNLFQSLFLKFEGSDELASLYEKIRNGLGNYGDFSFVPHLSILYKELPEEEKKRLIPTLQLPKEVTFNKLGINIHVDAAAQLDIENWRIDLL